MIQRNYLKLPAQGPQGIFKHFGGLCNWPHYGMLSVRPVNI